MSRPSKFDTPDEDIQQEIISPSDIVNLMMDKFREIRRKDKDAQIYFKFESQE